jgi:hypothetical protein
MFVRRVEIGRIVLDGLPLSADRAERFRGALAEKLAELLGAEFRGLSVESREHLSVDGPRLDGASDERSTARTVAQSVVRALNDG